MERWFAYVGNFVYLCGRKIFSDMFTNEERIIGVHGFTRTQIHEMQNFLHEKVNSWCDTNRLDARFAARELIGGNHRDWRNSPLQQLYVHYSHRRPNNETYAYREAAKAAGRLLKDVFGRDQRHEFDIDRRGYRTVYYIWIR